MKSSFPYVQYNIVLNRREGDKDATGQRQRQSWSRRLGIVVKDDRAYDRLLSRFGTIVTDPTFSTVSAVFTASPCSGDDDVMVASSSMPFLDIRSLYIDTIGTRSCQQ